MGETPTSQTRLWGLFVGWIPYGFLVIETFSVRPHLPSSAVSIALGLYATAWVIFGLHIPLS